MHTSTYTWYLCPPAQAAVQSVYLNVDLTPFDPMTATYEDVDATAQGVVVQAIFTTPAANASQLPTQFPSLLAAALPLATWGPINVTAAAYAFTGAYGTCGQTAAIHRNVGPFIRRASSCNCVAQHPSSRLITAPGCCAVECRCFDDALHVRASACMRHRLMVACLAQRSVSTQASSLAPRPSVLLLAQRGQQNLESTMRLAWSSIRKLLRQPSQQFTATTAAAVASLVAVGASAEAAPAALGPAKRRRRPLCPARSSSK